MTFKDLARLTTKIETNQTNTIKSFDRFKDLPFWIWDQSEHKRQDIQTKGNCCFNHVLELPRNNNDPTNKENPLFDYQELIYNSL